MMDEAHNWPILGDQYWARRYFDGSKAQCKVRRYDMILLMVGNTRRTASFRGGNSIRTSDDTFVTQNDPFCSGE